MVRYFAVKLKLGLFLVAAVLSLHDVLSQCSGNTCDECISTGHACSWCSKQNYTSERCQSSSNLLDQGCNENLIENPPSSIVKIIKNNQVGDQNAVQIEPQKIRIQTRPGYHNKFEMKFRAANNYPVDLYFLFDVSLSMTPDIKNLVSLSDDIGKAIAEISTNYSMGYGVFQDKVIIPFTQTIQPSLINPCILDHIECAPPFEFKHILKMTKNITLFKKTVEKTAHTGNIDRPEGSGDAIIQAITCKSEIGWRSVGRKLLIYGSNDRFHVAGDGKLAGIVIPNDGQCHLDSTGRYSKELELDYPTVSQLIDTVEKNEVHVIFAVSEDQLDLYKELSDRIPQSVVRVLSASPKNSNKESIKDIIEAKYKQIISEVKMIHNEIDGVDVQIKAKSVECEQKGTNECKGLGIGLPVMFDVDIWVTKCPKSPADRKKTLIIHPASLKYDKLEVEIVITCECGCTTMESSWKKESDVCSGGNGTVKCGICDCNKDRFGQACECDASEIGDFTSNCLRPNTLEVCSNNGICECGLCKCDEGYSDKYCQCNDKNCPSFKRQICGGPDRGKCSCSTCICEGGYKGSSCECPITNATCLYQETVCNGAGFCECGVCKCNRKGYVGQFCEECSLCGNNICDIQEYRACAECSIEKAEEECLTDCLGITVNLVDALSADSSKTCSFKQEDGCFLSFHILQIDMNVTILVQKSKTCPEPVNIAPIVGGVVGGVVAVGLLLLLLWKILTYIFDKIEYSRFQEDLKTCRWAQHENPFYKGATTTYKNPMLDTNIPGEEEKPM